MAGCGRGRVIAHPASGWFCSSQVNLTVPEPPFEFENLQRAAVINALLTPEPLLRPRTAP
jgi:hypothetical protein